MESRQSICMSLMIDKRTRWISDQILDIGSESGSSKAGIQLQAPRIHAHSKTNSSRFRTQTQEYDHRESTAPVDIGILHGFLWFSDIGIRSSRINHHRESTAPVDRGFTCRYSVARENRFYPRAQKRGKNQILKVFFASV